MNRTIRPRRLARHRPGVESLEARSLMTLAGGLNPTFGTGGSVIFPVIPSNSSAAATASNSPLSAVEANGKTVLASSYNDGGQGYFTIEVLETNGSPDLTFGTSGRASFAIAPAAADQNGTSYPNATSLVVRPDGTIDVGGIFTIPTSGTTTGTDGVIQVTPTGVLDPSFGQNGIAMLPASAPNGLSYNSIKAMSLAANGQLIVAGEEDSTANNVDLTFYAARFDTNGTLDATFGSGGIASIPVSIDQVTYDQAAALAIQPNGRIILAGYATGGTLATGQSSPTFNQEAGVVIGLTPTGSLDSTFGPSSNGQVILRPVPSNSSAAANKVVVALAVQPNGQLVLVGSEAIPPAGSTTLPSPTGELTRLNADGTLDTAFGRYGTALFTNGLTPKGVTIDQVGRIIVPGLTQTTGASPVYVASAARYNPDGTPDASFSTTSTPGLATYNDATAQGLLSTASISPEDQIIFGGLLQTINSAGTAYVTNFLAIEVYPLSPVEAEPPANYDGSGQSNLSVYLATAGEFAYRPTNGSGDVLVPFGIAGVGQTIPAPGDYDGAGQTEIAAYLPSQGVYAYRPAKGGPDVLQAFGIAGAGQSIPSPGDYFGTGQTDIAVYMPSIGAFGLRNPAGGPDQIIPLGNPGFGQSIPAPADYFGTGQTDLAVYVPSLGGFEIRFPDGSGSEFVSFGIPGVGNSIPIPGDYDGSGHTELAVYLPREGEIAYRPAKGGADVIFRFGAAGDGSIPVPGDYTGVGYDEVAVYDPNYASFAYRPANGGPDVLVPFGAVGQGASLPPAAPAYANTPAPRLSSVLSTLSITSTSVPGGPKASLAAHATRIASKLPAQTDLTRRYN